MLMNTFRKIVNELYSESFNTTIMEDIKRCKKKRLYLAKVFVFYFQKLVFGNIKKKQFSCIFEIKTSNIFG